MSNNQDCFLIRHILTFFKGVNFCGLTPIHFIFFYLFLLVYLEKCVIFPKLVYIFLIFLYQALSGC